MPQTDARGWIFQVGGEEVGEWFEIEALTEFSIDRSEGEEELDDLATFADQGVQRYQMMQRGASCELTARETMTDGVRAPGQARCMELARLVSDASVGRLRFRHVSQDSWEQWNAVCSVGESSGEVNDKTEWEVTFYKDGPETYPVVAA